MMMSPEPPEPAPRAMLAAATATRSDHDLARLAGSNGGVYPPLILHRELLRNPLVAALDGAEEYMNLAEAEAHHARRVGDAAEIERTWTELRRARHEWRELLDKLLDEHDRRQLARRQ